MNIAMSHYLITLIVLAVALCLILRYFPRRRPPPRLVITEPGQISLNTGQAPFVMPPPPGFRPLCGKQSSAHDRSPS
jgi:hypothetical protein